jgi:hypothetical protein
MRFATCAQRGLVQGLSLVAFTVLVVAAFVALEVGWRPSGPGSKALEAVNAVRKAAGSFASDRRDPLPDIADGSIEILVQRGLLKGPLAQGKLPIEGGGTVSRVRWIGVRNWRRAYVGITVDTASPDALEDLLARAQRSRAFQVKPVRGLSCSSLPLPGGSKSATLCFEL